MTRTSRLLLPCAIFAGILAGCSDPPAQSTPSPATGSAAEAQSSSGSRAGIVVETMDASGYTYVQVDDGTETFWAAAPAVDVEVGEPVVVPAGMAMRDFHSTALDRDFEIVYFVEDLRPAGTPQGASSAEELPDDHPSVGTGASDDASSVEVGDIALLPGGQSIAQLIEDREEFVGRTVSFRGRVVKFNANIMGKNWIHVQDGTGSPGTDDLTVTTNAAARVGDVVVVRGTLQADKDFGFGYAYEVIVEDAEVSVE